MVRNLVASNEAFFFVQVGANDGVLDDPLHDLIHRYNLRGLLIEPLPDLFAKLKINYKDEPQLLFENAAIFSHEKNVQIYRVRSDARVPHHWHGIASFNRTNLITQGVPVEHIENVSVRGSPLHSILAKHGIDKISLLQIDTEGYDYDVIKSAFESNIFPDIINYEHCWLDPNTRFICKQMLDKRGYQFIEAGKDTIAIRATSKPLQTS